MHEIYSIEIRSPNAFYDRYLIQTDEFSKVFTQYIKSIQKQTKTHKEQTRYLQMMYSHLSIAFHLY